MIICHLFLFMALSWIWFHICIGFSGFKMFQSVFCFVFVYTYVQITFLWKGTWSSFLSPLGNYGSRSLPWKIFSGWKSKIQSRCTHLEWHLWNSQGLEWRIFFSAVFGMFLIKTRFWGGFCFFVRFGGVFCVRCVIYIYIQQIFLRYNYRCTNMSLIYPFAWFRICWLILFGWM